MGHQSESEIIKKTKENKFGVLLTQVPQQIIRPDEESRIFGDIINDIASFW